MRHTTAASTRSKFFSLLGFKTPESFDSSPFQADLGPPREMGYMVCDYSQAASYISLKQAQNSKTIALRSVQLLENSATLDLMTFRNELSWPSVSGLISLEEAQNNKHIVRRAIYLL